MKKLSIESVKKLTRLEMKSITGGSSSGGGGGGGGGGGTPPPPNDCLHPCGAGWGTNACFVVCQYCNIPAGQTTGQCTP